MSRYFIVVDDVWDVETWDVIKGSFPINNFGSIIFTTTRMSNVAHSCSSSFDGHVYNIRHLDIVQSRHLFNRRLFNSEENCPSYLKEASEQILEKCVGLPLAIIAISGLLARKERVEHLRIKVKDSIGHALERNASVELMMKILSLSYYDLPAHLKTCLLYLSMYKEDYIIEKKELIRRWIGEGFVHKVAGYTTYELGERYFNELLNRSLIEPVKINLCGKLRSCRVLDTVLDFIISKSTEENFVTWANLPKLTVGTQEKVRRLCRYVDLPNLTVGSSKLVLSHVRSLSMSGGCLKTTSLDACRHLRVLHFGHFVHLEKHHFPNIGRFLRLRFLTLRWVQRYKELPEQIGGLGCLEILDIRGTSIRKLPATIVNLRKLVDLLVDSGFIFPDRIAKMQSLEVLKKVRVFQQQFNFLLELGQLKNLRKLVLDFGTLSSDEYTMSVEECKKVIFSSLHNLGTQNLCSLKIMRGDSFLKDPTFPTVLSLLKIRTRWSAIQRVPNWVASHVNLQQLRLKSCGVVQEDLCILGGLPALLILDLNVVLDCRVKRLTVSGGVGFRCLRQFFYHTFDGMGLVFAAGSMPKLQKLQLIFDADATEFLITGSSCDFGIENLPILDALTCNVYSRFEKIVEAAKSAMVRAASTHPNQPTLQTKRVYPPCE